MASPSVFREVYYLRVSDDAALSMANTMRPARLPAGAIS